MNKITVLIVDDERLARRAIRGLLDGDRDMAVVGEAADGEQACNLIGQKKPALIFLDVQMPVMTGIELVRKLPAVGRPEIIFVTAFDEYAINAFELHAADYLVKPFSDRRFAEALARVKLRLRHSNFADATQRLAELLEVLEQGPPRPPPGTAPLGAGRLVVKADGQLHFLDQRDIRWIEGQGDFVKIHLVKGAVMPRLTMTRVGEMLAPAQFRRIHKSTIVNLAFVRRIKPMLARSHGVELDDGMMLPIGRNYRGVLEPLA